MKKMMAAIAALIMIVAVPIGIMANDSEATGSVTGTYSVYAFDGTSWSSDVVYTYDAAQAVMASSMWANGDSMVAKYTPGTWVTYNYTTYGDITTFMGKTNGVEGKEWNVFIINNADDVVEISSCLGSYKCFDDYSSAYRTANVILYYGPSNTSASVVSAAFDEYIEQGSAVDTSVLTAVTSSDAFKVTFTLDIKYSGVEANVVGNVVDVNGNAINDSRLKSTDYTVTVVGYGSDCYIALKDAIGAGNISGIDTIPGGEYSAYGWMSDMFDLGTIQIDGLDTPDDWTDDSYAYWCIYDDADHLADFVIGAYSPLACAGEPFADNTMSLIYQKVDM